MFCRRGHIDMDGPASLHPSTPIVKLGWLSYGNCLQKRHVRNVEDSMHGQWN